MDASLYNCQFYIQKLEDQTEYNFPFQRVKNIKEQISGENQDEPKVEEVSDAKAEEIKEK